MNKRLARAIAGTLSGFIATLPMSVAMMAGRRRNVLKGLDPLPPRQITARALETVGLRDYLSDDTQEDLTVLNHFAYGATVGGIYGLMPAETSRESAALRGVCYGVGVWAISYLGWLPAAGLYRPATRDWPRRNLRMLAAHVVWGATMGVLTETIDRRVRHSTNSRRANGTTHSRRRLRAVKPR